MIAGVLLRNEWLKAVKRFAFWVTLCLSAAFSSLQFGIAWYEARHGAAPYFPLPDGWRMILGSLAMVPLLFASVVLILLVSNEFVWRTARQAVIDGLSKGEVFLGKALLIPVLGIAFLGTYLVTGLGFAYAATDAAVRSGALIHATHVSAMGGLVLAFVGYAASALFVGLAIRNPGSAVGVWMLYGVLEAILSASLVRLSVHMGPIVHYFPMAVFNKLTNYLEYDPEALRTAVELAARRHQPGPDVWGLGFLLPVAAAWIGLLLGTAVVWFRKRDL